MKRTKIRFLGVGLFCWTAGCAGHDDEKAGKPPTPPSAAEKIHVAVASVQLQDDCPSPAAAAEPQMEPAAGDVAPGAAADGAVGFAPMCVQSMVQISIESEADAAAEFSVRAVRLRKAGAEGVLGTMSAREPKVWDDSQYEIWDESVPSGASLRVGYALGDPDWAKVGRALGGDTWGPLYVVEIDVEVAGEVRTIVSPQIPRDEPENIVT